MRSRRSFDSGFVCGQTEDGRLIVDVESDLALTEVFFDDLESVVDVAGCTHDEQFVRAKISVAGLPYAQTLTRSNMRAEFQARLKFYKLKFYIVNFEFFHPFQWHFDGYDISLTKVAGYAEAEEEMRATKKPKLTAELTITSADHRIVNEYEAQHIAHDLCALLSLAKGCQIQWLYWDAFTSADVLVKSCHYHGVTTPYSTERLIIDHPPNTDLHGFVQQTFERYREVNAEGIWKFHQAIGHYVDVVSSESLLELKAIGLVVLVDYFTQRYADFVKTVFFVDPASFDDKNHTLSKLVFDAIDEVFSVDEVVQNEFTLAKGKKKDALHQMADRNRIKGLNRRSFKSLLKSLLKELDLYVDKDEIETFVKIRNRLVHESYFLRHDDFLERSLFGINAQQFIRIRSLTSRIMLAILQYHGYYYDWKSREGVEWRGSEKARVEMTYASDK